MRRIDALKGIMDNVTEEIVLTSAGKISREVFFLKDRPENFYVQGSMGACLPVSIGIAISKPSRRVVVLIGDGEALMGLDNLVLLKDIQDRYVAKGLEMAMPYIREGDREKANNIITENKFNLDLYILDNGMYQSTGNQRTISGSVNFRLLCDCKVIYCKDSEQEVPRISISHEEIRRRFMEAIK